MTLKKQYLRRSVRTLIAALFAILFLMPTILTMANSFMAASEIKANYGAILDNASESKDGKKTYVADKVNLKFIPDMVTFSQYITVLFKSPDYLLKFWNSVILVGPIVLFQLLIASGAAYSFTRYRGRMKEMIFFIYIILMLMPYQVTLVPNFLVSKWLGILNTRWAILLPGFFAPFSVFLLTKFMRRIPSSLIESAEIDGASEWSIFTKVCLPICKSSLFSVAILVFIDYWNMVEQPLILLSDEAMYPLSVFLSKINTGEVGLAFAVATIYMIPALLMFLYGEEYLIEGIAYSGAVKG
ncbi:MAG: carbohydrate ABC transporter permease [Velocimicrobium sp.]